MMQERSPYAPYPRLQSVSELTGSIRGLLETSFPFITVLGEISNLRRAVSGHLYFSLKDRQAQIRAVMFKQQCRYLAQPPADGQEVVCRGRVSVYEPRGEYQLVVDYMESKGAGELQIAFDLLKRRLEGEGLFAASAKKPLPFLPERIALITSPTGAAVFDFLRTAAARFPSVPVEIHPVRVQGQGAAGEIVAALAAANTRRTAEVIVLCRGGGSLEDLWSFNEEQVARAIFASEIPVVVGVGHEMDFTIADFVADVRAPTPTAAAALVLPRRQELHARMGELEQRLVGGLQRKIGQSRYRVGTHRRLLGDPSFLLTHFRLLLDHRFHGFLHGFTGRLKSRQAEVARLHHHLRRHSPLHQLRHQQQLCAELTGRLRAAVSWNFERRRLAFSRAAALLDAVSPLAVLGRGYAIARTLPERKVVRAAAQVRAGDAMEVLLQKGSITCRVTATADEGLRGRPASENDPAGEGGGC
jgi:exodeoxyribonuclease VII large subunit